MAFSYGFFNAKNLDRTYTAENFNDYLGSIICDGIQDNFGQCFKLSSSKLKLTIGSGKAWIQGHYFISDMAYTYDLSRYVDESLSRYLAIGICCNTSENVRNVAFEILAGTPATNPSVPKLLNTDYKKYLTLCIIRLDAGTSELKITDYRENGNFCGYVRCILGKCKVTDMLAQLSEIQEQMKNYNTTVNQLQTKINELMLKAESYPHFCSSENDYALYFNQNDFSWAGTVFVMFLTPIAVTSDMHLLLSYLVGVSENATFYLVKKTNKTGAELAQHIYEEIKAENAMQLSFQWLYSDDFLSVMQSLEITPAGEYYLAFSGTSDNSHPMVKSIKFMKE